MFENSFNHEICLITVHKDGWWVGLYPVRKLFRMQVCRFEKADMENVMALHGWRDRIG